MIGIICTSTLFIIYNIIIAGIILCIILFIVFPFSLMIGSGIYNAIKNKKKNDQEKGKLLTDIQRSFKELGISKSDIKDSEYIVESALHNKPGHKFWEIIPIKNNIHRVNIDITNYRESRMGTIRQNDGSLKSAVIDLWHKDFNMYNKRLMENMYKIASLNKEPTIFKLYFYNAGIESEWYNGYILIDKGYGVYMPYIDNVSPFLYSDYHGDKTVWDKKKEKGVSIWGNNFRLGYGGLEYEQVWAIELFKKYATNIDFDSVIKGDSAAVSFLQSNGIDLGDMKGWTLNYRKDKTLENVRQYNTEFEKYFRWPMGVFNVYSKKLNDKYCSDPTYRMIGIHNRNDYKDIQQVGNDVRLIKKDGTEIVLKNADKNYNKRPVQCNINCIFTITPHMAL